MDFLLYILVLAFFGFCCYNVCREFYSYADHGKWKKDSRPDPDAEIVNTTEEQVKYIKNGAKYKTTIFFSDGFYFITHKTNQKNGLGHYTISIDSDLRNTIKERAIAAHTKAVSKKLKQ